MTTRGYISYKRIGDSCFQLQEDYEVMTSVRPPEIVKLDPFIQLEPSGLLTLRCWYTWDGATGGIDTPSLLRSSCGHDGLCELMASGKLQPWEEIRLLADQDLYRWAKEDGVEWVRTRLVWRGVRVYARLKRRAATPLPVLRAPRLRD